MNLEAVRDASVMSRRQTHYNLGICDGKEHPWRNEFGDFDAGDINTVRLRSPP